MHDIWIATPARELHIITYDYIHPDINVLKNTNTSCEITMNNVYAVYASARDLESSTAHGGGATEQASSTVGFSRSSRVTGQISTSGA